MTTADRLLATEATLFVPADPADPDGESVAVVYRPGAVSLLDVATMLETMPIDPVGACHDFLAPTLVSWDVKWRASDPETIPVTRETMSALPFGFLYAVMMAIVAALSTPATPAISPHAMAELLRAKHMTSIG